jgi:hypothetical protein
VVADLLRIAETWRPDLIVWDYADYGGCVAAEVLGIPHVSHEAGATFDDLMSDLVAPLADLRATYGLSPDPDQRMLERYLVLSPFPPSLQGARVVPPPTLHCYRATPFDRSGDEVAPERQLPIPDAPLVYASLGTAFNTRTALLGTFIEALRDERVNLVVTVGRDGDPEQFGPQPPNVRIEQYIPQTLLFPPVRSRHQPRWLEHDAGGPGSRHPTSYGPDRGRPAIQCRSMFDGRRGAGRTVVRRHDGIDP